MNEGNSNHNGQIIYFSHGGGPLPILGDPTHNKMNQFMKNLSKNIRIPDSIIVISAHWEEEIVTVQSGSTPDIMYDYYGFPDEAYNIEYPCKGNSKLASKIAELFKAFNIKCMLDDNRPYDHGSYIPLKMIYPKADIPVLQISLNHNLNPLTHLKIGKALRSLLNENILIVGSGFSFHNMREYDFKGKNTEDALNNSFQDKLIDICCNEIDEEKRWKELIHWENIPGARYCHPREEHLLPLFVCVGLAKDVGVNVFDDYIIGKRATAFYWG